MPRPISRRELIRRLRALGWDGPYPGGSHMVMMNGSRRITIPNPHRGDIDWSLTKQILAQAGISRDEWEALGK
jgi:predicted RNA binding protein YcfA (HicA-like mRNA interferase family)